MSKDRKELAKVIEKYFGADAGYLDIDCFTLARRIIEAGWTKVVRCKNCWHFESCEGGKDYCWSNDLSVTEDDFCSYGERTASE